MGALTVGLLVIVGFTLGASITVIFLVAAVGQSSDALGDMRFRPASYQPMAQLVSRPAAAPAPAEVDTAAAA